MKFCVFAFVVGMASAKDRAAVAGGKILTAQKISTESKVEAFLQADKDLRQYTCVNDVPEKAGDWENKNTCPQNNDGECCVESEGKSQVVGFLLQFFLSWTGAGYFYYGLYTMGGALIGLCLGCFCCCLLPGAVTQA